MKKILALVLMDEDVFDELCSYRESRVEIKEAWENILSEKSEEIKDMVSKNVIN